jgi:hypothetical protein
MRFSALDPKIEVNQNFGVNEKGVKGSIWDSELCGNRYPCSWLN